MYKTIALFVEATLIKYSPHLTVSTKIELKYINFNCTSLTQKKDNRFFRIAVKLLYRVVNSAFELQLGET